MLSSLFEGYISREEDGSPLMQIKNNNCFSDEVRVDHDFGTQRVEMDPISHNYSEEKVFTTIEL